MAYPRRSPWGLLYDAFELDAYKTLAYRGTALADAIPGGINLSNWTQTLTEDCTDIADITVNAGAGPWWAPGISPAQGLGSRAVVGVDSGYFVQEDATTWGLHAKRVSSTLKWAGIASATWGGGEGNYAVSGTAGFAQQYGYFEIRAKLPDPNTNYGGAANAMNGILWPTYWFYSTDQFPLGDMNLGTARVELDAFEMYPPSEAYSGEKATWRSAVHKHDTRRFVSPGESSRDTSDASNPFSLNVDFDVSANLLPAGYPGNFTTFSTDANFRFFDDYHTYGMLLTPEWMILYLDRIEHTRFRMITEFHKKYVFLISNAIYQISATTPTDFDYTYYLDYVYAWQNPDWHEATGAIMDRRHPLGGGTANAKTFTPTIDPGSLIDGLLFTARWADANTSATTINYGGYGAKPVIVGVENPANTPGKAWLEPVTYRALVPDDIEADTGYAFKFDTARDSWILLDEGRAQQVPPVWAGNTPPASPTVIDLPALEAGIAHKMGLGVVNLFPVDHPARTSTIDYTSVPPIMAPNAVFDSVEGATGGDLVGAVVVRNTPTNTAHYVIESNANFRIDPDNGEIYVKEGVTLAVGTYEAEVSAWSVPPVPIWPGSNVCRVTINARTNIDFEPVEYFGTSLAAWWDFTDAATLTLSSGKIAAIADKSNFNRDLAQATSGNQPLYDATAFNGVGCADTRTAGAAKWHLTSSGIIFTINKMNRFDYAFGQIRCEPDGVLRTSYTFDTARPHIVLMEFAPGGVTAYLNGEQINMEPDASPITITGWLLAVAQCEDSAASGMIYSQNDNAKWALQRDTALGNVQHVGLMAQIMIGTSILTTEDRDKLFGYMAHECWASASDILPITHPYYSTYPKMYS